MQKRSGYLEALSAQHRRPYVDTVCFTNYTDQRGCKSVDKVMSGSQRSSRSSSSSISSSHTMGPFICRVPHCHTSTWGGELVRADIRHFVVALAISGFGTQLSVICVVLGDGAEAAQPEAAGHLGSVRQAVEVMEFQAGGFNCCLGAVK